MKPSQSEMIRRALLAGAELSPLDALQLFKCGRLAPRILELRAKGMPIETITERRDGKSYARYRLATGQGKLL